jgi:acetolactate synthase I/II/III large subunit
VDLKGSELLTAQLVAEGVDVIFGIPGIHLMHVLDAIHREPSLRFITTRHEQATTYMADGYSRVTGCPGVAMVVPGPGVYNAASGLATAWASSSPVILIAGQIEHAGLGKGLGLTHEIHDQLDVVRPITKSAERLESSDDIAAALRRAFATMMDGRTRPVEIEIAPELFSGPANGAAVAAVVPARHEPDPDLIDRAAGLLCGASNPLLVGGAGVVLSDAAHKFTAVAERLQAAVVNTREGKGCIDERNPLFVGTAWVNRRLRPVIEAADVVLAVGTRGQGLKLRPDQTLIHIDVDAEEFGKHGSPKLAIESDALAALELLVKALDERGVQRPARGADLQDIRYTIDAELHAVGPQHDMVKALRAAIPEDGVLATGTTTVGYMCHLAYPVYHPRTYITSSYMGTLGYCFPTALGAKVGRPDLPVVSINGDGGFMFCASELATAVQYGINVVTVVFNDSAYGNTNRDQIENFGGRIIGTELVNPDFVKFAESFGAVGVRVTTTDGLRGAVVEGLGDNRPVVIEMPMERLPSLF